MENILTPAIVKSQLKKRDIEIRYLKEYLADKYPD